MPLLSPAFGGAMVSAQPARCRHAAQWSCSTQLEPHGMSSQSLHHCMHTGIMPSLLQLHVLFQPRQLSVELNRGADCCCGTRSHGDGLGAAHAGSQVSKAIIELPAAEQQPSSGAQSWHFRSQVSTMP